MSLGARMGRRAPPAVAAIAVLAATAGWLACGQDEGTLAVSLDAGPARCPSEAPATEAAWSPPPPPVTPPACDPQALALVESLVVPSAPATFTDIESALRAAYDGGGAACASCMFSGAADGEWGPVVYVDGGAAIVNYGACFARAAGGSDACGKAVQQQLDCLDRVCSLAECGPDAVRSCAENALQDQTGCGRYPVTGVCGDALSGLTSSCRTLLDVVTRVCGAAPAAPDAGAP